jgi:hypothetical protein
LKPQNGISISILRRTILFFICSSALFVGLCAGKKDIQIHFENDSVTVEKGSTFTNFLVIENKSSEEITIQNIIPQEKYPGLLFYPKNDFTLGAGQSKNLPVKLIANVDFMKLRSNKIQFRFRTPLQRSPELKAPRSLLLKEKTKTSQFIRPHTKILLTLLYPNRQFC